MLPLTFKFHFAHYHFFDEKDFRELKDMVWRCVGLSQELAVFPTIW
jgi:hypothetical protein